MGLPAKLVSGGEYALFPIDTSSFAVKVTVDSASWSDDHATHWED